MIVILLLFWTAMSLFMLKVGWNLYVAVYFLYYNFFVRKPAHSISLMPFIEIPPLLLAWGLAFVINDQKWYYRPWNVLLWGFAFSVASFAVIYLSIRAMAVVHRRRSRGSGSED